MKIYYPDMDIATICKDADAILNAKRKEPARYWAELDWNGNLCQIGHGTTYYTVSLRLGTCTCPYFKARGLPCKHLLVADYVAQHYRKERCPDCYGDGYDEQLEDCARCNGRGWTLELRPQEIAPHAG